MKILLGWFKFPQEAGEPFKAKASSPNRELILRITSLDKNWVKRQVPVFDTEVQFFI